jgi:hypothetical protein
MQQPSPVIPIDSVTASHRYSSASTTHIPSGPAVEANSAPLDSRSTLGTPSAANLNASNDINLDFSGISNPLPTISLDYAPDDEHNPSPSSRPEPPLSLTSKPSSASLRTPSLHPSSGAEARLKGRPSRRLSTFFGRLSSGGPISAVSPARSQRKASKASLHTLASAGDTADRPRDSPADQEVSQTPCHPPSVAPSEYPSAPSLSIKSTATGDQSLSLSQAESQEGGFPEIYTSTTAQRLSVPVAAYNQPDVVNRRQITSKMHQTSSRLLRMTEDERPYTRVS